MALPSVPPIIALSTAWCSARHHEGEAMLAEMAGLGFGYVELSHGIRLTLVPGILKGLGEGTVKVSSTHNFCPLPAGMVHPAPNLFEPSAPASRGHEQEQWLRHSRRTLDFAAQVRARVVVMHLGSVRFFWLNPARQLRKFVRRHPFVALPAEPRYQQRLTKVLEKLGRRRPAFWEQTRRSLGLENRERLEELPADSDFPGLLESFAQPGPVGYWHDTGHAELKERMGVITQRAMLEANSARLIGFHLHDVDETGRDHQPIGKGRVDFRMIRQFYRPHHLLVLELSPRASPAEVRESRMRIEDVFG
jgi:sugar phosphate isomerase/epimerase